MKVWNEVRYVKCFKNGEWFDTLPILAYTETTNGGKCSVLVRTKDIPQLEKGLVLKIFWSSNNSDGDSIKSEEEAKVIEFHHDEQTALIHYGDEVDTEEFNGDIFIMK